MRSIDGVKKCHDSAASATQIAPYGSIVEKTTFRSVASGRGGQSSSGDTAIGTSGS